MLRNGNIGPPKLYLQNLLQMLVGHAEKTLECLTHFSRVFDPERPSVLPRELECF